MGQREVHRKSRFSYVIPSSTCFISPVFIPPCSQPQDLAACRGHSPLYPCPEHRLLPARVTGQQGGGPGEPGAESAHHSLGHGDDEVSVKKATKWCFVDHVPNSVGIKLGLSAHT